MRRPVPGYLYMLRCADGSYYVGSTTNLEVRLAKHQAGECGAYTADRLPVELVYCDQLPSLREAFLCEWQVKGWSRAKKEALIRGDYDTLVELSRARSQPLPRKTKLGHAEPVEARPQQEAEPHYENEEPHASESEQP